MEESDEEELCPDEISVSWRLVWEVTVSGKWEMCDWESDWELSPTARGVSGEKWCSIKLMRSASRSTFSFRSEMEAITDDKDLGDGSVDTGTAGQGGPA